MALSLLCVVHPRTAVCPFRLVKDLSPPLFSSPPTSVTTSSCYRHTTTISLQAPTTVGCETPETNLGVPRQCQEDVLICIYLLTWHTLTQPPRRDGTPDPAAPPVLSGHRDPAYLGMVCRRAPWPPRPPDPYRSAPPGSKSRSGWSCCISGAEQESRLPVARCPRDSVIPRRCLWQNLSRTLPRIQIKDLVSHGTQGREARRTLEPWAY